MFLHFDMRSLLLPLAFTSLCVHAQQAFRIPVVVHVIHDDGNENISEAQIRNGIEILTRNWRKQNPDTVEIVEAFRPIAADMEVEFELARLDPDGNCTNGINRLRSPLTTSGTHNVKELIHWPRDRYLNIYVTRNAAGLAGHALMPFQADSIPQKDGIVIQGSYFGNIGTSNDLRSVVLSHEVGHYLNLFHIWGGNNVPEFYYLPVGQQANCAIGDAVDDTPETTGWSSCNLGGTSCDGQLDNVQNFMDYAYCARMFTQGQKARVHAALNSPIAQRNNLWTEETLEATGLSTPASLCKADFRGRRNWCVDELVELEDLSYHAVTAWSWNVGAGPILSDQHPSFSYSTPGVYDVSLTVSNASGFMSTTRNRYLRVLAEQGLPGPYQEGFEGLGSLEESNVFMEYEAENDQAELNAAAASGSASLRIPNHGLAPGRLIAITSPRLDVTNVPNPVLRFKYAFAQRDAANSDRITVRISRDCGKTWIVRRTIVPADMPTVPGFASSPFSPGPEDWTHVPSIAIPPSYATNNLLIRIEFVSGGGSDLFIDDINLDNMTAIGIDELDQSQWTLAPNPTDDVVRIEGPLPQQRVEVFSSTGLLLADHGTLPNGYLLPVHDLVPGMYLLRLSAPGISVVKQLMVMQP